MESNRAIAERRTKTVSGSLRECSLNPNQIGPVSTAVQAAPEIRSGAGAFAGCRPSVCRNRPGGSVMLARYTGAQKRSTRRYPSRLVLDYRWGSIGRREFVRLKTPRIAGSPRIATGSLERRPTAKPNRWPANPPESEVVVVVGGTDRGSHDS